MHCTPFESSIFRCEPALKVAFEISFCPKRYSTTCPPTKPVAPVSRFRPVASPWSGSHVMMPVLPFLARLQVELPLHQPHLEVLLELV